MNTPGYKADTLRFEEVLDKTQNGTAFVDTPETSVRMTQGALRRTDNPMDVAISGEGFFVVETAQGERLTRSGRMIVGHDGMLRTTSGHKMMGDSGGISVPSGGDHAGTPLVIESDGRVMQGPEQIGRLKRVAADAKQLMKQGTDLFDVQGGIGGLDDVTSGELVQGYIEDANVNPVMAMTQIIQVQRSYEALQQVVRTYREVDGQSVKRMS